MILQQSIATGWPIILFCRGSPPAPLHSLHRFCSGRTLGLSCDLSRHGTQGSLGFQRLLFCWHPGYVRADLCHRLPLSRTSLALDLVHGGRSGSRDAVGGQLPITLAPFTCGHDHALPSAVCSWIGSEQTGNAEDPCMTESRLSTLASQLGAGLALCRRQVSKVKPRPGA